MLRTFSIVNLDMASWAAAASVSGVCRKRGRVCQRTDFDRLLLHVVGLLRIR